MGLPKPRQFQHSVFIAMGVLLPGGCQVNRIIFLHFIISLLSTFCDRNLARRRLPRFRACGGSSSFQEKHCIRHLAQQIWDCLSFDVNSSLCRDELFSYILFPLTHRSLLRKINYTCALSPSFLVKPPTPSSSCLPRLFPLPPLLPLAPPAPP